MARAWNADKGELTVVSDADAKELARLGVPTGAEAELTARENGWEGKVAAGATSIGNALGLGIPKLLMRATNPGIAHEVDRVQQANPKITLAGDIIGGGVTLAALPGGAAARIAAAAYSGGTGALDESIGSGDWGRAVKTGDYKKVAENFAQGVGIAGLLGSATEGAAYVLAKAAPAFQKATGKLLTDWSNKGYFQKVVDLGEQSSTLNTAAQRAESVAARIPDAPLATPKAPTLTQRPPPLPEQPFASAQLVEDSPIAAQNIERARARGDYDTAQAERLNREPLSIEQSQELRTMYDQQAREAAEMQPWEGELDNARSFRAERDRVPQGLDSEQLAQATKDRAAFQTVDPEIEGAFDKAGFNQPAEPFAPLPEPAPVMTDIPKTSSYVPTEQLPEPAYTPPRPGKLAQLRGTQPTRAIPDKPLPAPRLPKFARPVDEIPSGQYQFAPGKEPKIPAARLAANAGLAYGAGALGHPFAAGFLARDAKYAAFTVADGLYKKAQLATINRANAINLMVSKVTEAPIRNTAKAVRSLIEGSAPDVSAGYISGDVDKEYQAISQGVAALQANPEQAANYTNDRYHPLSTDPRFMQELTAHRQNAVNYLAAGMPKQTRAPGLLDGNEPYDPPRSVKLRFIQRYNGVNDPHSTLIAPTYESVAAVQAVHPQTLAEVRQQLAQQLADERKRTRLSPEQQRNISIVMGIPANWINSPAGIAAIAAISEQPQGQKPQQPASKQSQAKVNLGAQAKGYVSMLAAPSDKDELDNN